MTVKSACGTMIAMVITIAALGAIVLRLMELNMLMFIGIPIMFAIIAIAVIAHFRAGATKAEINAAQERNDAAQTLKETETQLSVAMETHKKQSSDSAAAVAALEADLSELVSMLDAILAGDFSAAKRVRLRGIHSKNASSFASGMAEICADMQSVATALSAGDLKRSLNAARFHGDWNKMAHNVNSGLSNIAAVVAQTKAVCDSFTQGNLNGKVEADARGDLLALKTAVNNAAQNLSKYAANIGEIIQREGQRGKGFLELPGDFAYLKSVISSAIGNTSTPTTPIKVVAPSQNAVSRTSGARTIADGAGRFSGAPRVNDAGHNAAFDFNRKDFGKY